MLKPVVFRSVVRVLLLYSSVFPDCSMTICFLASFLISDRWMKKLLIPCSCGAFKMTKNYTSGNNFSSNFPKFYLMGRVKGLAEVGCQVWGWGWSSEERTTSTSLWSLQPLPPSLSTPPFPRVCILAWWDFEWIAFLNVWVALCIRERDRRSIRRYVSKENRNCLNPTLAQWPRSVHENIRKGDIGIKNYGSSSSLAEPVSRTTMNCTMLTILQHIIQGSSLKGCTSDMAISPPFAKHRRLRPSHLPSTQTSHTFSISLLVSMQEKRKQV